MHCDVPGQVELVDVQVAQQRLVPSPNRSSQVSPAAQLELVQSLPMSPLSMPEAVPSSHDPPLDDEPEVVPLDELVVPLEAEVPLVVPLELVVVVVPVQLGQLAINVATSSEPQPVAWS